MRSARRTGSSLWTPPAPVYDEVRTEIGDELVDMALAAQAG